MKLFSWLITAVLIFLALAFALANRQSAMVNLWPFGIAIQAPLFLLTLGTLFLGLLLGAVIGWVSNLPHRAQARRLRHDIAGLREKIETLQIAGGPQRRRDDRLTRRKKWYFFGSKP
jgi:uncharacterized integral membrane protein